MRAVRVVALFAAVLFVAGAIAGCGGGGGETTTQLPEAPEGKAEVAGFHGVHSGEVEIALEIDRYKQKVKDTEEVNMRILGNFKGAGEGELPELDLGIESHGPLAGNEIDFNSGFVLTPERAVISYGPTGGELVYQPDKTTFEELKSDFEDAQGEGGEGDPSACLEAAGDVNIAQLLHDVSYEGKSETLDGKPMEVVGADLDLSAAVAELIKMSEDEGCRAQLDAVGVPPAGQLEALEKQLEKSVTAARVTLGVDRNGVIRYLKVLTNIELPRNEELEVELVVRLSRVNEVTELPEPTGSTPFEGLLKKFGVDLQQVKEAENGERLTSFLEGAYLGLFERGSP